MGLRQWVARIAGFVAEAQAKLFLFKLMYEAGGLKPVPNLPTLITL
jgi:hypothetical protein